MVNKFDRWLSKRLEPMEFVCIKGMAGKMRFPETIKVHASRTHAVVLRDAQVLYEVSEW